LRGSSSIQMIGPAAFEKDGLWLLRKVDYLDVVFDLYVREENIFDGVFQSSQS